MPQIIKSKRFILLISIILFLIIGGFCFYNFNSKSENVSAAGESWLTGWNYRKPITITNNAIAPAPTTCTGGTGVTCTVSTSGNDVINTYKLSGSTTGTATWTVPTGVTSVDYLVVGGGGGGGLGSGGGGGGAGGFKTASGYSVVPGNNYNIVVGAGGAGATNNSSVGVSGGSSTFDTIVAAGGGGGGSESNKVGAGGASGGGGCYNNSAGGAGISGQGNNGGIGGNGNPDFSGGGGGGCSTVGEKGGFTSVGSGGDGGAGCESFITGGSVFYAGGGGGHAQNSGSSAPQGMGGVGGGGNGGVYPLAASYSTPGVDGFGGGGGAEYGGIGTAEKGGSGVVIIRYTLPTTTLTDYQVKVNVPYSSKMNSDYSDVRFTSSDGSILLNYYRENPIGKNSSISGNPVLGATGKFESAISLDGSGDYISVPDSDDFDFGTGNFTIDWWIKYNVNNKYQTIFSHGYASANGIVAQTQVNSTALLIYLSGSVVITESSAPALNTWYHYALVRNGTSLVLYRNGISVGSATNSTSLTSTGSFDIGNNPADSSLGINGYLDEFRVSNYTRWTSNFTPPTSPYVTDSYTKLLMHFNEISGQLISDYSVDTSRDFYVKVPSISSSTNIYMYYGKSDATTASNGENTFDVFDDFNDGILNSSKWTAQSGTWTESGGMLNIQPASYLRYSSQLQPTNYVVEFMIKASAADSYTMDGGIIVRSNNSTLIYSSGYQIGINTDTNSFTPIIRANGGVSYGNYNSAINQWYWVKATINNLGGLTANVYNSSRSSLLGTNTPGTISNTNNYFGIANNEAGSPKMDEIRVRKTITNEPTVSFGEEATECFATGGIITRVGDYCVHTFTSSGTFTPTVDMNAEVLVVAGGGGGGGDGYGGAGAGEGGGGAGGLIYNTAYGITSGTPVTTTIGAGGTGGSNSGGYNIGSNGSNSVFGSLTAIGGGGGGAGTTNALAGGSGGGAGYNGSGGTATSGQGNIGASGNSSGAPYAGHGGGGAGGPGSTAPSFSVGGAGGSGLTYFGAIYAAGGKGSDGWKAGNGIHGTANTGNGGTGGGGGYGGNGGSGIVVVRYSIVAAPVLTQVTPVSTPTTDTTPNYTFNSTESGTITYGGSCSSSATSAIAGDNTITFNELSAGTYGDCTITVDGSNVLNVNSFTIISTTTYTSPNLTCYLTNEECADTTVFRIYDYYGGHAELSSVSPANYSYKVCCEGTGISNACSGTFYDTVLKLSSDTNAHVEKKTESNYSGNDVCLHSDSLSVTCDYADSCSSLGDDYVCLASISGDTNAHVGECSVYSTKVCCMIGVVVDDCTSKIVSNKSVASKDTDIQLCSGADVTNPSDPCYSVCWKGTGDPDVTSSDWICSVCHDASNIPVSCSTLGGTTFDWVMPDGYIEDTDYTLIDDTTLADANPIINFTNRDDNRILTLDISSLGVSCSGQNSVRLMPTWKEITPF